MLVSVVIVADMVTLAMIDSYGLIMSAVMLDQHVVNVSCEAD